MKWTSHIWAIPYLRMEYIKIDPMHVLFTDGVVNKAIAIHLYQMCVARKDVPGHTIAERVANAWDIIKRAYEPHAPPMKKTYGTDVSAKK